MVTWKELKANYGFKKFRFISVTRNFPGSPIGETFCLPM